MLSGILLVDKPKGWRSRQVVDAVGKALSIRKVGHAGTLDPAASGLIAILLNEGTKISQHLMDGSKIYRAMIALGKVTDSYDADGVVVSETDPSAITEDDVRKALQHFRGTIMQMPPQIAAIKVAGKAAYKYARAGQHVELQPRPVTIHSLQVTKLALPEIEIEVECSKGTYIRSIAHDLGQMLGVGGHLKEIRRVASAPFHVRDAVQLEAFLLLPPADQQAAVLTLDRALPNLTKIEATPDLLRAVANGIAIRGETVYGKMPPTLKKGDLIQIVTPERIAILELKCDAADLGPPPWTGQTPFKYQRILHRH